VKTSQMGPIKIGHNKAKNISLIVKDPKLNDLFKSSLKPV